MATERASLDDATAPVPAVTAELVLWNPEEAEAHPWLADAVAAFESLDNDGGRAAERWLKEDALTNDPSTKTYLMVDDGTVEGFFACCAGSVQITRPEAERMGVPYYSNLPACVVAWVARRRDGALTGEALMLTAYGLARWISNNVVGMVALALDPLDEGIAEVWKAPPYGFRRCRPSEEGGRFQRQRLYVPLAPGDEDATSGGALAA